MLLYTPLHSVLAIQHGNKFQRTWQTVHLPISFFFKPWPQYGVCHTIIHRYCALVDFGTTSIFEANIWVWVKLKLLQPEQANCWPCDEAGILRLRHSVDLNKTSKDGCWDGWLDIVMTYQLGDGLLWISMNHNPTISDYSCIFGGSPH